MPLWAQGGNLAVEFHADPSAHTDDHRLPIHGGQAIFEMINEVSRDQSDPILGTHYGFELRPLRLELLLALDLLPFRRLFKLRVDLRTFGRFQFELREPALIVD